MSLGSALSGAPDLDWSVDSIGTLPSAEALAVLGALGGRYFNIPPYHDEPKFFHLACVFSGGIDEPGLGRASGTSWLFERAAVKALGETVERLSAYPDASQLGSTLSAADLDFDGPTLSPDRLLYARPGHEPTDADLVRWTDGWQLTAKARPALIPAQLVYLPYEVGSGEPMWYLPTSNGLAAGQSLGHAAANGILELLEREALMRFWSDPSTHRQIDPSQLDDPDIDYLLSLSMKYRLEAQLLQLETLGGLATTVVCVLKDATGIGPWATLGLKASFDLRSAIIGAIEEAHQLRPWLRELQAAALQPPAVLETIDDRAIWWLAGEGERLLASRLAVTPASSVPHSFAASNERTLGALSSSLTSIGLTVWVAPVASAHHALSVARVVIPEIAPIVFDERYNVRRRGAETSETTPPRHPLL